MKKHSPVIVLLIFILTFNSSCKEDEPSLPCEEENTGMIIITNNYTENPNSNNSLSIFINREARSSNDAGDLSIPFGQIGEITLPAGIHEINVYRNTGYCTTRCFVSREFEGSREVDLDQCEELNMAYGA